MSAMIETKSGRGFLAVLCAAICGGVAFLIALIWLAVFFLTGSGGTPAV